MFQADSSIFFTIKYTYLRKITDFLLFKAKGQEIKYCMNV